MVKMKYSSSIVEKIKSAIHLVSSAIFAKDLSLITTAPNPILVLVSVPIGILLNVYIRYKTHTK